MGGWAAPPTIQRVRGRRADHRAPADGDRALRQLERREAAGGARAAPVATREELLGRLRALGDELGRTPTARDIDARKGAMPSKSLLWHTFGSLAQALREAGFDVPVGEERLERAVEQGAVARPDARAPAEDGRLGGGAA